MIDLYKFLRPLIFTVSPEAAHRLGLLWSQQVGSLYKRGILKNSGQSLVKKGTVSTPFGNLTSRLGLAAGCDKNAEALFGWEAMGFAFVEVGTVTPKAQNGNPKPRLFRVPESQALVNRLGFNNHGAEKISERIRLAKQQGLKIKVGGNIGKNLTTPIENAAIDYQRAAEVLAPVVDYLTINVSSPNTPGLRELQGVKFLQEIVTRVKSVSKGKPIFIKVAPDNYESYMKGIIEIVREFDLSGIICGNTVGHSDPKLPKGGLSGQPIFQTNLNLMESYALAAPGVFLIGVGGIGNPDQARAYLNSGASLYQIYTGFIYAGPRLIENLLRGAL